MKTVWWNILSVKLRDKTFMQSMLLTLSSIGVILVTLISNYFLTKILSKDNFGSYSLVMNIFVFSQVIFNFGFFFSIGRLVSTTERETLQRQYYAAGVSILFVNYLIALLCLVGFIHFFAQSYWKGDFIGILTKAIPFVVIFLFINFSEAVLPAANRIKLLALTRLAPKFLFLIAIVSSFFFVKKTDTVINILSLSFISGLICFVYVYYRLLPLFKNQKKRLTKLWRTNKSFGFNVYIGSVLAVGASSLSGILISFFSADNTKVGLFYIASQLAAPLALIPNIIATVSFRKFANETTIDKKLEIKVLLISLMSLVATFILGDFIILNIYGQDYKQAVFLLYILAVGSVLYGISDFYNRFLLSNGRGRELRNTSLIVGAVLIISDVILIKLYNTTGAATATILAGVCYLCVIRYHVSKSILHLADRT
jgi:O-antigen/teichoic acid export membrane protein